MCDDDTELENDAYLTHALQTNARIGRRALSVGAGASVGALLTGCGPKPTLEGDAVSTAAPTTISPAAAQASPQPQQPSAPVTSGKMVEIPTPNGTAEAFFVAPQSGKHPGVIIWPDVAGLREAFQTMATRLANEGYAVLAVNPYYRSSKMPILSAFSEWRTDEGRAKIAPMREALTPEGIASDGAAFAAWLDKQAEVDTARKLATTGYCMGGPFTFWTAAAAPTRIGVLASFHGGGLVTDEPTSPHASFPQIKAAALICIAKNDDERDPEAKTTLQKAAEAAGIAAEIEVYPAQHGWCAIDSPVYEEEQAERAWASMRATFERAL